MALSDIALVSVAQAQAVLGVQDSASVPQVEQAINIASSLAETVYTRRPLKKRPTKVRMAGPWTVKRLFPLLQPIDPAASLEVVVNGAVQTVWKAEADGDPNGFDVEAHEAYFWRSGGWAPSGASEQNVVLTYTGGYDPTPDDLAGAVLELVQKLWGPLMQGRLDVASLTTAGGSVQFLDGVAGGSTAPWALTRRAFDVFAFYTRYHITGG